MKLKIKNTKRGFSIFLAVIVTSALLIISFSVIHISLKQTEFSNLNRESQYAIFAADAGIECALYWDAKNPSGESAFATNTANTISCAGKTGINASDAISGTTTLTRVGGGGDTNPTSVFGFVLDFGANATNACAIVTVNKDYTGPGNSLPLVTRINSRGYNNCTISDPHRVERAIEVIY